MNGLVQFQRGPALLWRRLIRILNKNPDEKTNVHQSRVFWFFRCWHRKMSWPLTRDGCTFRVCLRCGMRRNFDLEKWKMTGGYYYARNSELVELPIRKGTNQ